MVLTDPRIKGILDTVNGEIANRGIRHALFLERLKSHEMNEIIRFLNGQVFPDISRIIRERLTRSGMMSFTTTRLKHLTKATHQVIRTGMRTANNRFAKSLYDIALSESEWQAAILNGSTPKIFGIDFVTPSAPILRAIVKKDPFGELFYNRKRKAPGDWFSDLGEGFQQNITNSIKFGMVEGESIPQIMRRIRGSSGKAWKDGVYDITRRNAAAVARTGVAQVANNARMATYEANSDVIKGWAFLATLDARTTEICMAHDGNEYKLGEGAKDRPPLHFQCRSITVPITKSWEELGLGGKGLKEPPPGTRASREYNQAKEMMAGEVPAVQTYGQWLKRQPKWVQVEALGVKKAELFRSGKVTVDKFVNRNNRVLRLDELQAIDAPQGGGFVPAKTIEEAEAWAAKNAVIDKVDYTNLELNIANDVNKRLHEVVVVAGGPKIGGIATKATHETGKMAVASAGDKFIYLHKWMWKREVLDSFADGRSRTEKIAFAQKQVANRKEILSRHGGGGSRIEKELLYWEDQLKAARASFDVDEVYKSNLGQVSDIITHEYGHLEMDRWLEFMVDAVGDNIDDQVDALIAAKRRLRSLFDGDANFKKAMQAISDYSGTSLDECFAESYVAYKTNGKHLLRKEIIEFFDTMWDT